MLGGGGSASTTPTKVKELQVQSSSMGLPITIGWGRGRINCNLIWYNDFKAIAHKEKQGKGLGGAKTTSYTYSASVIMALCEGTIQGIRTIWRDKDVYRNLTTYLSWDGLSFTTATSSALQQVGL